MLSRKINRWTNKQIINSENFPLLYHMCLRLKKTFPYKPQTMKWILFGRISLHLIGEKFLLSSLYYFRYLWILRISLVELHLALTFSLSFHCRVWYFLILVLTLTLSLALVFYWSLYQVYIMLLQVKHTVGRKWEYFHYIALQPIMLADVDEGLQ